MYKLRAILRFSLRGKNLGNSHQFTNFRQNSARSRCPPTDDRLRQNGGKFESKLGTLMDKWLEKFQENRISEPKTSLKLIIAHAIGCDNLEEIDGDRDRAIDSKMADRIGEMCEQRLQRIPIQYILGEWDFRDLTLKMTPPVFIPRPETEQLVDIVANEVRQRAKTQKATAILELCCGSGAISLALLKLNPQLTAVAVDCSTQACNLTRENARYLAVSTRLTVIEQDISAKFNINQRFDLIVSNPPYVPTRQIAQLQPEIINHEDLKALDGGVDGLDLIKIILTLAQGETLQNGGNLFLEVDATHPAILEQILREDNYKGLRFDQAIADFNGKDRFVIVNKL